MKKNVFSQHVFSHLSVGLLSLTLAACNAGPLLKTGSLSTTPAAPKPVSATERALHVGATSARAQKCGFYFDPDALRTNFLAAEAARGTPPDALAQTERSYVYTTKSIALKIPNAEVYCTAARTEKIKTSLQAALAGNFDPPVKKVVAATDNGGLLGLFDGDGEPEKKWDPNTIYDPILNDPNAKR